MSDFDIEAHLFLEGVRLRYGYDFRDYAESSLRRRVQSVLRIFHMDDPILLLQKVLREPEFFQLLLPYFTVTTTEMFRDPEFFRVLREAVVPILRTYPTFRIWVAGCSTGEEVFSLCILLAEEELIDRSLIFATDINPRALKKARDGIYSLEAMKTYTKNYQEACGKESFSRYYTADYGFAKMDSDLLRNVVFSEHNLVTDHVFTECQLILCRNVLIYFNHSLQERVLRLFEASLRHRGILALGSKENLRFTAIADRFEVIDEKWRLYRKGQLVSRYGKRGNIGNDS